MLSASQQPYGGARSGPQGFAAAPRVVQAKSKYKDPYGHVSSEDYTPHNIMYDKRVYRGSTNAAMVIPAGTYPDKLFHSNQTKYDPKAMEQQRAKAAEEFFTRDVKTPEAPPGKQNIDIQTDQFVSELTDKAPVYEIGCQTAFKIERPPTAHRMPKIRGVSKKTLVEDNELFIFDDEVEPLLSVICGKTLECARMEVLEEEELRLMKRQQDHYADLNKSEKTEIERMEEEERQRLAIYETKKKGEIRARGKRIEAHEKVVSRQMAKSYMSNLRGTVFTFLGDAGFFPDQFKENVLHKEVMPWVYGHSQEFADNFDSYEKYPNRLIVEFMADEVNEHTETVRKHREHVEQMRLEAMRAEEKRLQDRADRRARRAAKKKAEQIEALRNHIDEEFIKKGTGSDDILKSPLVEADGYGTKETPVIGMLGGWLGQAMIVFNTLAKSYKTLDKDRKSSSSKGTPKSAKSGEDRAESGIRSERRLINANIIQEFLYNYIQEKLKSEILIMNVSRSFEQFLLKLEKKMQLNEMRYMKEDKYLKFREIISKELADPVLEVIRDNQTALGMDPDVFDLVYEGFWDLYCMRARCDGITPKMILVWINRFVLQVSPDEIAPEAGAEGEAAEEVPADVVSGDADEKEDGEDEKKEPESKMPDVAAIVRVRIPKQAPEAEANSHGSFYEVDPETIDWSKADEVPPEDKAFSMSVNVNGQQVWQFNQLAQRVFRRDLAGELKNYIEPLEALDIEEFNIKLEREAERFEEAFCGLFADDSKVGARVPKIPVFNFSPTF